MAVNESLKFSVIICSYNPIDDTLIRLINAIEKFDETSPEFEVIIVDNNCSPALESKSYVKDFLSDNKSRFLLRERQKGLTAARIAGIQKSRFDWLVFFDDDNEPASDYLNQAKKCLENDIKIGAIGSGNLTVEYLQNPVTDWMEKNKRYFQYRNYSKLTLDNKQIWQNCYPYGTGLIISRKYANIYFDRVFSGRYSLSDRSGNKLSSGGDLQLVLTVIEQGGFAGTTPKLRLNHIIVKNKTKTFYLMKQRYGTSSAYLKAHEEVFGPIFKRRNVSEIEVLRSLVAVLKEYRFKVWDKNLWLSVGAAMGTLNALSVISEHKRPNLLKVFAKLISE